MKIKQKAISILVLLGTMVIILFSCNDSDSSKNRMDQEIIKAEKPQVDSSRVLETLDLYRAKRYEGIQEALGAGAENVHKLVLYGRKMGTLSPDIGHLTYLASLDVAFNELAELPEELSSLHYLQGIYANGNNLTEFPEQILLLPLLAKVDLTENQITSIPGAILRMDQLTRLSMDKNALMKVPVQLYELKNLTVLELADNGISELPQGISNLAQLKKLDLANNQLKSLPKEIITLTETLTEINVQGNQIPMDELEWFVQSMPNTRIRY